MFCTLAELHHGYNSTTWVYRKKNDGTTRVCEAKRCVGCGGQVPSEVSSGVE